MTIRQSRSICSPHKVSTIFKTFYPNGNLHKAFETLQLDVALDGISECLYNLKKMYHLLDK